MTRRAVLATLALLAAACGDYVGPEDESELQAAPTGGALSISVQRVSPTRGPGVVALATFSARNTIAERVMVFRCDDIARTVQRLENGAWTEVARHGVRCPANVRMAPLFLGPGDRHESSALIPSVGTFRIGVEHVIGSQSSIKTSYSGAFEVR